jgi:hypothetical protein
MSFVLCDIIKETMKDTITTPALIIRAAKNRTNCEKMPEIPTVNLSSTDKKMPNPIFSAERSRKRADPTVSARLMTTRAV